MIIPSPQQPHGPAGQLVVLHRRAALLPGRELGIPDDSSLDTVLAVQHALLPARDRVFPEQLNLAHDYGVAPDHAQHQAQRLGDRLAGPLPHLRDFGPVLF